MHETPVQVRWSDLDPYDHVNHAVYLTYFENARIDALEQIGWGMGRLREEGLAIVVAEVAVRFRRPALAGDGLVVHTWAGELRPASAHWHQQLTREEEILAEADVVGVLTSLEGRPRRMPPSLTEAMKRLRP